MSTQIEVRLPPKLIACRLARAAVASVGSALPEPAMSDVELLASEVVANAVKHGNLDPGQEILMRIIETNGRIRVEVTDRAPPFEVEPREPPPGTKGWGLFLVDTIASSWGVEPDGVGKTVWFEIAA
jgi:anti-sigma regulatory factor (Ser/Thr protein kinase)